MAIVFKIDVFINVESIERNVEGDRYWTVLMLFCLGYY
jgi:hypothetical protein